ncbi:MAG TPA: tyrosine-protein phosphatase [Candidatus Limnocylindria bacterium]
MPTTAIRSVANFREVGGLPTTDGGRVQRGLLYRSGALTAVTPEDAEALQRLRIRTVYDLRTNWERDDAPDQLPDGARYVHADIVARMGPNGPGQLSAVMADPSRARAMLGEGRGTAMWMEQYRSFVVEDGVRQAFGRVFVELATVDGRPALLHCSTGKDRTGWAVAALLWLLGVPDELVMRDYLASQRRLKPFLGPALARWEQRGGDPRLLAPIFAARRTYLEAGRREMVEAFGTVERYFLEGMGVPAETQHALREAFLERVPQAAAAS